MTQEPFSIDSVLRHCAENRQRTLISVAKRRSAYCIHSDTLEALTVHETRQFCNISTLRVKWLHHTVVGAFVPWEFKWTHPSWCV